MTTEEKTNILDRVIELIPMLLFKIMILLLLYGIFGVLMYRFNLITSDDKLTPLYMIAGIVITKFYFTIDKK